MVGGRVHQPSTARTMSEADLKKRIEELEEQRETLLRLLAERVTTYVVDIHRPVGEVSLPPVIGEVDVA